MSAPSGRSVRPTTDRVREAVFNALGSMRALEGSVVLDLFAGSGAMGIEALSRGAEAATFVDRSRSALDVVRSNVTRCDFESRARIVQSDASGFLRGSVSETRWDLAILDPPYDFDRWAEVLDLLVARVAVIESDRAIGLPEEWVVVRERSYGASVVTIAEGHPPPPSGGPKP